MDEYGHSMLDLSRKVLQAPPQSGMPQDCHSAAFAQPLLTQQHADSADAQLTEAALMRVQALMDEIPRCSSVLRRGA